MPDLGSSSWKLCACALLSSLLVRHSAQDGWGASVYLLYYVTEDPGPHTWRRQYHLLPEDVW